MTNFHTQCAMLSSTPLLMLHGAPLCFKDYFHCTELGGTKVLSNLLSPLSPHCIPQPPSHLSPLLCSYPNKLATQVAEGRRRGRRVGGLGLVAEESAFSR